MSVLPPVPRPLDPSVQRFTATGRPTPAQVEYETRLAAFLAALAAAILALQGAS